LTEKGGGSTVRQQSRLEFRKCLKKIRLYNVQRTAPQGRKVDVAQEKQTDPRKIKKSPDKRSGMIDVSRAFTQTSPLKGPGILHGSVAILCAHAQENKLKSVPLTVLNKTIIASEIIILIQWAIHGRLQAVGRILTIAAAARPFFS